MGIHLRKENTPPHVELLRFREGDNEFANHIDEVGFHGGRLTVNHEVELLSDTGCRSNLWPMETTTLVLAATGVGVRGIMRTLGISDPKMREYARLGCQRMGVPNDELRLPRAVKAMLRAGILSFDEHIPLFSAIHPGFQGLDQEQRAYTNQLAHGKAGMEWLADTRGLSWLQRQQDFFQYGLEVRGHAAAVLFAAGIGQLQLYGGYQLLNERMDTSVPTGITYPDGAATSPESLRFSYDDMGV